MPSRNVAEGPAYEAAQLTSCNPVTTTQAIMEDMMGRYLHSIIQIKQTLACLKLVKKIRFDQFICVGAANHFTGCPQDKVN